MLYKIALGMMQGIGCKHLRVLMDACGDPEILFKERKKILKRIPGFRPEAGFSIADKSLLEDAERELTFIEKHDIRALWYQDPGYPQKLKHCEDAPLLLFAKGNIPLNAPKILSIVGTRKATSYGIGMCEALVAGLKQRGHDPLILSGLAYGIDICAHRAALKHGLKTGAVLGHSLQEIYPTEHRGTAAEIVHNGALITEFHSLDKGGKINFVRRNRIIAGMSEATLIIESGMTGGSLITAELALSYHREVFCVPGRSTDTMSKGCNRFIRDQKAALIESPEDLEYQLGWKPENKSKNPIQLTCFPKISPKERNFLLLITKKPEINPLELSNLSGIPVSEVFAILLEMELKGMLESRPGDRFIVSERVMI